MEQPAEDLGGELRRLYRAAGSPAVDTLVELSRGRLPDGQRPTPAAVRGWLDDGAAPVSCEVLLAFVAVLDSLAERACGATHLPRSAQFWELLWYRRTRPPADAPATADGTAATAATAGTDGTGGTGGGAGTSGPVPAARTPGAPRAPGAPGATAVPGTTGAVGTGGASATGAAAGTAGNVVEGQARLLGPTVQAGAINGGVHVHPPAASGAPPPPAAPPPRDPRVVIRVQRGSETIEFYDEGLARIWITAVLDQRQSEDGRRGDDH
ncbi:hypothetical protein MUU72_33840 [Streptomyces sp. RS10V-4]|uniref:hypothetical protein n=1 Tax=Streptomyces rhizoryzae TaxID=2932493 RepID=UPI00200583DA|nr:hypothetical protein [Streptomyces rhizoryzae]MCK7628013.1 hypothetical protein [Streptomyces rhizoryzae]